MYYDFMKNKIKKKHEDYYERKRAKNSQNNYQKRKKRLNVNKFSLFLLLLFLNLIFFFPLHSFLSIFFHNFFFAFHLTCHSIKIFSLINFHRRIIFLPQFLFPNKKANK